MEDGFSELEALDSAKTVQDENAGDESEDELISAPNFFDDDNEKEDDAETSKSEMEISDTETDLIEEVPSGNGASSALFQAIVASPGLFVRNSLDKWVQDGNYLDRRDIYTTMYKLRRL